MFLILFFHRSSVYKFTATTKTSDTSKFKMPAKKLKSPPGVKTRARRSSIYHKGGLQLSSPPSSRTRRRSMYVPAKSSLAVATEFSKVWATPIRSVDTALPASPELGRSNQRKGSAKKSKATRSPSPVKISPEKPPVKQTPKSPVSKPKKTPRSTAKKNTSPDKKEKTPRKIGLGKKTPESLQKTKSPQKSTKKIAPASSKKRSTRNASPVKSPKSVMKKDSTPRKITSDIVKTSTPSKSVEDMTGKSFYSTPKQTPIPQQRQDEVFVFSAKPPNSSKKTSVKRLTIKTPQKTPRKRSMKTPKKTPLRKTPANKKRSLNSSASSPSPAAKRTKTSPSCKGVTSDKPAADSPVQPASPSPQKKVLTPTQMSSILRDVEETERQEEKRSSLSPSPRPRKLARLAQEAAMSTPRVTKMGKRTSPKKLAEFHDRNQSCDVSLLDDTYNTDSRSGRCVIL